MKDKEREKPKPYFDLVKDHAKNALALRLLESGQDVDPNSPKLLEDGMEFLIKTVLTSGRDGEASALYVTRATATQAAFERLSPGGQVCTVGDEHCLVLITDQLGRPISPFGLASGMRFDAFTDVVDARGRYQEIPHVLAGLLNGREATFPIVINVPVLFADKGKKDTTGHWIHRDIRIAPNTAGQLVSEIVQINSLEITPDIEAPFLELAASVTRSVSAVTRRAVSDNPVIIRSYAPQYIMNEVGEVKEAKIDSSDQVTWEEARGQNPAGYVTRQTPNQCAVRTAYASAMSVAVPPEEQVLGPQIVVRLRKQMAQAVLDEARSKGVVSEAVCNGLKDKIDQQPIDTFTDPRNAVGMYQLYEKSRASTEEVHKKAKSEAATEVVNAEEEGRGAILAEETASIREIQDLIGQSFAAVETVERARKDVRQRWEHARQIRPLSDQETAARREIEEGAGKDAAELYFDLQERIGLSDKHRAQADLARTRPDLATARPRDDYRRAILASLEGSEVGDKSGATKTSRVSWADQPASSSMPGISGSGGSAQTDEPLLQQLREAAARAREAEETRGRELARRTLNPHVSGGAAFALGGSEATRAAEPKAAQPRTSPSRPSATQGLQQVEMLSPNEQMLLAQLSSLDPQRRKGTILRKAKGDKIQLTEDCVVAIKSLQQESVNRVLGVYLEQHKDITRIKLPKYTTGSNQVEHDKLCEALEHCARSVKPSKSKKGDIEFSRAPVLERS